MVSRIVYSRRYNIGFLGIERLHPFDSRKHGRAYRQLKRHFGRTLGDLVVRTPREITREQIAKVHSTTYLDQLHDSACVAAALELPLLGRLPAWLVDRVVLRPMRWVTQGTIIATQLACQHGFAVNLSGGYHHAKPAAGEGFCIYSDIGLAVHEARTRRWISETGRVAYIDLDAHQGNGVCHVFREDPRVFMFDMYNAQIYPFRDAEARERIDCGIRLSNGCADQEYLGLLKSRLPGFLDSIATSSPVELAIYNAGTDIFAGDPLGQMNVSAAGVLERDLYVTDTLRRRGIPTVMLLSGGYTSSSYRLVADSVIQILERNRTGRTSG